MSNIIQNVVQNLCKILSNFEHVFVITHTRIESLITNSILFNFKYKSIIIDEGENTKDLKTIDKIINDLTISGCNRNSLIIGLGGGVISDIAGIE